ncbi:DUF3999 domain-containing protein [uncultured Halomonas sp.]|uniref:DUF3999 domain-containing protein n=1 Tax=uncultured Halomonas sp. TaxID=173971 RepID=UPI00260A34D0|nr:DUF3999 domain-containing protein [uncultured Halomonas sp.]
MTSPPSISRLWLAALLCWTPLALAGGLATAWQQAWPIIVDAGAPAYRLTLPPEVYATLHTPALADLQVFDSRGRAVPTLLRPSGPAEAAEEQRQAVPWFPLPLPASSEARWELIAETDPDGRLRRVESRGVQPGSERGDGAALVDLGGMATPVTALELEWEPDERPVDSRYRVEASDDLEGWRRLPARGRLLDIAHEGEQLVRRRLELGAVSARYLRLRPDDDSPPIALSGVAAVTRPPLALPDPEWRVLAGTLRGEQTFHYRLTQRLPVTLADVESAAAYASQWRLYSREHDDDAWRLRAAPWTGYRLAGDDEVLRSAPQALRALSRDRQWRLVGTSWSAEAPPGLRLGYHPEQLLFLAEGEPPWRLAAGSARESRRPAPVEAVLTSLVERHGTGWQPAAARLGEAQPLAGEAALRPARDWTQWLLWGVLILGAGLVGGLALRLLRS